MRVNVDNDAVSCIVPRHMCACWWLLQLLFTLALWLTLRQFMRERRLAKLNVSSEGIILQPFGMIFSDPDLEVQGESKNFVGFF